MNTDSIVSPEAYIAVPALQAISYCKNSEELRNMYANLLATSMLNDKKEDVHPSFGEIIKQLSPDEARMNIFKQVMTFRYGWSREGVESLNMIPVVFSRKKADQIVRDCWKKYYECLCIQNPDEMQIQQRSNALFKLLESMAKVLGYKNVLTWEEIQNPYIPQAMVETINNNTLIQSEMVNLIQTTLMNMQASNPRDDSPNIDT